VRKAFSVLVEIPFLHSFDLRLLIKKLKTKRHGQKLESDLDVHEKTLGNLDHYLIHDKM